MNFPVFVSFVSFLPAAVCLFLFAANFSLARRTESFSIAQILLAVLSVFFYSSTAVACSNSSDCGTLALFFARQLLIPIIIPLFIAYLRTFTSSDKTTPQILIWAVLPVSLFFAEMILLLLIGVSGGTTFLDGLKNGAGLADITSREMQLLYICCVYICQAIVILETVFLIVWISVTMHSMSLRPGTIWKFLSKGEMAPVFQLQCSTLLFLALLVLAAAIFDKGAGLSAVYAAIAFIITATIFIAAHFGRYQKYGKIYSYELHSHMVERDIENEDLRQEQSENSDASNLSAPEEPNAEKENASMDRIRAIISSGTEEEEQDESDAAALNPEEEDSLRARFENLMVSEQLYLRQGIKISDIATMLNTNRTYVSRLVNNTYCMSFSDYINTLRIDYAEQYLLHNRNAKQSDIAIACGFPNASSFNNIFKKITGVTPKIWLATRG